MRTRRINLEGGAFQFCPPVGTLPLSMDDSVRRTNRFTCRRSSLPVVTRAGAGERQCYAAGGSEEVRTSRTYCGGTAGRGSTLWLAKRRRWVVLLPVLSTMENGRVVGETDEEAFRKQRSGADSGCSTTRGPRPCSAAFACAWPLCSQGGLMMAEITPDPIMRIAL